jgi:transcriptional regulator with XRE-family HTH domain
MGYRGKQAEQERARRLRSQGWTLADIAEQLGVAKSSVSTWVRDVEFTVLGDDAFLAAGVALYAGEGAKGDGFVMFANSDPAMIRFFCSWFRRFFTVDENRLRVRICLHEGLDLDAAEKHWSEVTGVPRNQFIKPYRAAADGNFRRNKHEFGCAYVSYSCSRTHRAVMGLVRALLSTDAIPG